MKPRKNSANFIESKIDDDLVLMNIHTGRVHGLAGTGLAIWNLIDGARDLEAMKTMMARNYKITVEACGPDIDRFIAKLEKSGFVARG